MGRTKKASPDKARAKNRLKAAAAGYKGTDNVREQLLREMAAYGETGPEVEQMVDQVIASMNASETGTLGNTYGKGRDPQEIYDSMKKRNNETAAAFADRKY